MISEAKGKLIGSKYDRNDNLNRGERGYKDNKIVVRKYQFKVKTNYLFNSKVNN